MLLMYIINKFHKHYAHPASVWLVFLISTGKHKQQKHNIFYSNVQMIGY